MSTESVDVAVIGAGTGGGVVANELAQSGLRVALFDRGRRFSAADFGHDELADSQAPWNRCGRRFGPDFTEHQTYRPDPGVPARQASLRDGYFSIVGWVRGWRNGQLPGPVVKVSPRNLSVEIVIWPDCRVYSRGLAHLIRRP